MRLWLIIWGLLLAFTATAADDYILVASTTSTQNSGLFDSILPQFEQASGVDVRVVAVGTGAALELGRRCDADVVFVHAPAAEKKYVDEGYAIKRHPVMYNDFVIIGPGGDPASIEGMQDPGAALAQIAAAEAVFVSRGDNSGTHKKEMNLWASAGIDPSGASGTWYRETGSGMGATLNTARAMGAYTLVDRGTWLSFNNRAGLEILVAGAESLYNPYGVMRPSPKRCPQTNAQGAKKFIQWLTSEAGQQAIGAYRLQGKQLFHPNANSS